MQIDLQHPFARLVHAQAFGDAASLAARLLAAWLFVPEGWGKLVDYAAVQSYMAQFGVEPRLLPLAIALELAGGVALAAGLATRPLAIALGLFSLLVAVLFHAGGGYSETLELHKDFAIAGGLFALAALGPGRWSLDARIARWIRLARVRAQAEAVPR